MSMIRTRWAAIGAAVAVTLGAGGIGLVAATSPADATTFVAITPCRLVDTRPAPNTVGQRSSPLGAADTHTVTVHGDNGKCTAIPAAASAVLLNVTALNATATSFLTIWASDAAFPLAASLNPAAGAPPTPNAVTTELSSTGQFNIFNQFGTVNVVADVTGYYVDHDHDDRYYNKAQSDDRLQAALAAQPWNVAMPASGAALVQATLEGLGVQGGPGIRLPDGNFPQFTHGFTVPPHHRTGQGINVRITWMANEDTAPGCNFLLRATDAFSYRGGRVWSPIKFMFDSPRSASFPGETILTATDEGVQDDFRDNLVQTSLLSLDGAAIAAGDHVSFQIERPSLSSLDNCSGSMTVFGLSAESL